MDEAKLIEVKERTNLQSYLQTSVFLLQYSIKHEENQQTKVDQYYQRT